MFLFELTVHKKINELSFRNKNRSFVVSQFDFHKSEFTNFFHDFIYFYVLSIQIRTFNFVKKIGEKIGENM